MEHAGTGVGLELLRTADGGQTCGTLDVLLPGVDSLRRVARHKLVCAQEQHAEHGGVLDCLDRIIERRIGQLQCLAVAALRHRPCLFAPRHLGEPREAHGGDCGRDGVRLIGVKGVGGLPHIVDKVIALVSHFRFSYMAGEEVGGTALVKGGGRIVGVEKIAR